MSNFRANYHYCDSIWWKGYCDCYLHNTALCLPVDWLHSEYCCTWCSTHESSTLSHTRQSEKANKQFRKNIDSISLMKTLSFLRLFWYPSGLSKIVQYALEKPRSLFLIMMRNSSSLLTKIWHKYTYVLLFIHNGEQQVHTSLKT